MRLVSYRRHDAPSDEWRAGIITQAGVHDVGQTLATAPHTMMGLLADWAVWQPRLAAAADALDEREAIPVEAVQLGSPLPHPASFRDFYAFEQHVKTARARRGLEMIPEWYHFPVFYFSNAAAFSGPEARIVRPGSTEWLDYELEVACIIGKGGVDIRIEHAADHIAGFCVLNDWSARDVQREEVKVGLGPAKGKDFATSMGPYLVTPDELVDKRREGKAGYHYDLAMVARVNGIEYSRGNLGDLTFSFAEMIARASADCPLYPGDVIGSGTVGTGCILELGPEQYPWLMPGDVVELEVERLGILRNYVVEKRA